ncbi:MAG: PH domain-containing protein [Phycisphaerae bacterium]|nr:PH domain-containing protein [Phycisphaerae bacterium]
MTRATERAAAWMYRGVWGVLVRLFRVPADPPSLPCAGDSGSVTAFRPAPGYLRYLRLCFWVVAILIDLGILGLWAAVCVASPTAGVYLAIPASLVAVVPDIVAYIAVHLRYDTTWYVMTDRSLRIRAGIWTVEEVTITFENIQSVEISSGPLQRFFGIADVVVTTAGGGAGGGTGAHGEEGRHRHRAIGHRGVLTGLDCAADIRDLILSRAAASAGAGLGDEPTASRSALFPGAARDELRALRAILCEPDPA